MAECDGSEDFTGDPAGRQREWFRYYSQKRIQHQLLQVQLLAGRGVDTVLEVGPNLGLVTALLDNAGFRVTTLDLLPAQHLNPRVEHIQGELTAAAQDRLAGFDAIICCETLEHLHWADAGAVLAKFRAAAPRCLVISVPYQGFQIDWRLYLNARTLRHSFSFKKLKFLKRFKANEAADPYGHKWEVGYRGHSLTDLERLIAGAGWQIAQREFTTPTRSVFYLLEPMSE